MKWLPILFRTPKSPRSQPMSSLSKEEWHYHFSSTIHINHRWVPISTPRGLSLNQTCPLTDLIQGEVSDKLSTVAEAMLAWEWDPWGPRGSSLPGTPGQLLESRSRPHPPPPPRQPAPRGPEGAHGPQRGGSNWRSVRPSGFPGSFQGYLGAEPLKGLSPQAPSFHVSALTPARPSCRFFRLAPQSYPEAALFHRPSSQNLTTRRRSHRSASRFPRQSPDCKPKLSKESQSDRQQKCDLSSQSYLPT